MSMQMGKMRNGCPESLFVLNANILKIKALFLTLKLQGPALQILSKKQIQLIYFGIQFSEFKVSEIK